MQNRHIAMGILLLSLLLSSWLYWGSDFKLEASVNLSRMAVQNGLSD